MSVPSFDQHYPRLGVAVPQPGPGGEHAGADGGGALARAYDDCARLTRAHSKSFFFSTQLLPPAKRAAIRALYAFCRTSDDLVDLHPADAAKRLADWRRTLQAPPRADDPVPLAWADVVGRYGVAPALVAELLAGMEMDLSLSRYDTFADLWVYCYRVASVVGLMSMQIIGHGPGAAPYAIKLGVALQLTNILRDVGEDAARGRIYLPREDLERFGVAEDEVLAGRQSPRMQALLQFEIDRAHQLYELSWPGIALLSPDSRGAVATAACVYRGILDKIVANRYDVFA
ncbi:MAG TPA: phytoene/squalene synthase family protein, partial [Herpetosiphonaceae bacterium]